MFRGSPGLTRDQLSEIAAAMGGDFDADTQQTVTQYFFTVPSDELDLALHIASIRMAGVDDSEAQWTDERGAIEQEVASDYSNPSFKFYLQLLQAMYKGTPLTNPGLGTRPTFDKTTAAMMKTFYDRWYAPNNAVLVIVGDIEPQATLQTVKRLFGAIPAKRLPERQPIQLEPVEKAKLNLTSDLPYGAAYVAFRMPGTSSPDWAAADVLADVLASQRGALYGLVPQGKALFATFQLMPQAQASVGMAFAAYPGGPGGDALLAQMQAVIAQDVAKGVSPSLVAAAKRDELLGEALNKNSIDGLANAWSSAVAIEGRNSPEEDIAAIERVTVAQVNAVARKYLDPAHAIEALLVPQPSGQPVSRSSFGGSESFAPKNAASVALPAWASAGLFKLKAPAATTQPLDTLLPNGLRLIVQPETISNTVSVAGLVRGNPDLVSPPGQLGVSQVLDSLFSYGTTKLDRLAFQKALDDIGANESAGGSFSLQVLAPDFERGLALLAQNELHPALPAPAFAVVRQQTAGLAAGELKSPGYLASRALQQALVPAQDPTLRQVLPANVSKLTLADVRAYQAKAYRPGLATIVVIGNINPARARAAVERDFGGWRAAGPPPPTVLPSVPPNRPVRSVVPDRSRVQDDVTLAETVGLNRYNPDYYALQLGNYVLSGGFVASRLYRDLRQNAGLVYFVSSSVSAGRTRATYSVNFGCDPPKAAEARAIVVRDLEQMRNQPVSAHELEVAKAVLLRQMPLAQASVDGISSAWLSRAALDLPLNDPQIAARAYIALTAGDVQQAFRRWIDPARLAEVVQGPAPK